MSENYKIYNLEEEVRRLKRVNENLQQEVESLRQLKQRVEDKIKEIENNSNDYEVPCGEGETCTVADRTVTILQQILKDDTK